MTETMITAYYENYQEAVDEDAENYNREVAEFLRANGIRKYAKSVHIVDGDQDGFTMVAKLEIPERIKSSLGDGLTLVSPYELEKETNYL